MRITRRWESWSPCEKLRRATSIPAIISSRSFSREALAGPMVHTIFVLRAFLFIKVNFLNGFHKSLYLSPRRFIIRENVNDIFLDCQPDLILKNIIDPVSRFKNPGLSNLNKPCLQCFPVCRSRGFPFKENDCKRGQGDIEGRRHGPVCRRSGLRLCLSR